MLRLQVFVNLNDLPTGLEGEDDILELEDEGDL